MKNVKILSCVKILLLTLFALTIFILVLTLRIPAIFRPTVIQMRYGFTIPIPIIFLFCLLILSKDKWINAATFFIFVVLIFAMALGGVWASGQTEGQVISGILPDTDAAFYYYDALRYINGFRFSYFGARRIFFSAFLGIPLVISKGNLQITLGVITFLLAVACFYATLAVWKHLGSFAASLFFILIFSYARLSVGELMSESLGLILSCFSFYFFFHYLHQEKIKFLYLFVIPLVLGLITRAGPVGIFPLLVLGISLRKKNNKISTKKILCHSLISILLVVFSFMSLSKLLSPAGNIPFANFAHSFYGIANGGSGWTAIYRDHPELEKMPEPQLTHTIFTYALDAVKNNPLNLLKGIVVQYPQIFNFPDRKGFFSFFGGENKIIYLIAQILIFSLFFYGFYMLLKNKDFSEYKILLYALFGILITVPLFPFSDFKEMRVYAATIPFIIIFPAIGLEAIIRKLKSVKFNVYHQENENIRIPIYLDFALLFCTMIMPLLILKWLPIRPIKVDDQCQSDEQSLLVNVSHGSYLGLLKESELYLDWLPYFHESRFKKGLHNLTYDTVEAFSKVTAPSFITSTIDLRNGQAAILIFKEEKYLLEDGTLLLCGKWDDYDYSAHNANLFFVQDAFVIQ